MSLTLPNTITNGQPISATPVQANFAAIETDVNDRLYKDGTEAMTGALTLSGAPTLDLHASTKKYVDDSVASAMPAGSIVMWGGSTAPSGWTLCNGGSYSVSANPLLDAQIGGVYGTTVGDNGVLPNFNAKFPVGKDQTASEAWADTLGETGGSKAAIVVEHSHTINHGHGDTFSIATSSAGTPSLTNATGGAVAVGSSAFGAEQLDKFDGGTAFQGGAYFNDFSFAALGAHGHTVNGGVSSHSGSSQTVGSAGTTANLPPYLVVNFIIKLD